MSTVDELSPKGIIDPTGTEIQPSDMVPRMRQVLIERNAAFKHTNMDSKPVCFILIVVAADSVIVKVRNFGVFSFGHHPLNGQELFVQRGVLFLLLDLVFLLA